MKIGLQSKPNKALDTFLIAAPNSKPLKKIIGSKIRSCLVKDKTICFRNQQVITICLILEIRSRGGRGGFYSQDEELICLFYLFIYIKGLICGGGSRRG